jgi:hypothetical protein
VNFENPPWQHGGFFHGPGTAAIFGRSGATSQSHQKHQKHYLVLNSIQYEHQSKQQSPHLQKGLLSHDNDKTLNCRKTMAAHHLLWSNISSFLNGGWPGVPNPEPFV